MTVSKVMLLGEIGVGKSSLVRRLMHDTFDGQYAPTIGVDVYRYAVPLVGGGEHQLLVWDTDGNFGDRIFTHVYSKGAEGALIAGDISRPETLAHALRLSQGFIERFPGRPCVLVDNKIDLDPAHQATSAPLSSVEHLPRVRTSAATGQNVKYAFEYLADAIRRRS